MRGRTVLTLAAILTLAASTATVVASPTPARAEGGAPVITHPVPAGFTLAAGVVCAFEVTVAFPASDLTRYTWNAHGRPVLAVETGTTYVDVTNTATGATVRRDLSDTSVYTYPDPSTTVLTGTRIVALLGPLDSPPNQLLFANGGLMSMRVTTASGTRVRTVLVRSPREENLCETLAS